MPSWLDGSGDECLNGVAWGRGASGLWKTLREKWPTWKGPSCYFRTGEERNPSRILPKAFAATRLLSQREEENMSVAVRTDVHTRAPECLLDPGASPRLQMQIQRWAWLCVGPKPQPAHRGLWLFSGHQGLSTPRCLMSGTGHKCPLSICCELASWFGGSVFWMLEAINRFWNALHSSRCRSWGSHCIRVDSWAGLVPALDCQVFRYMNREAGANEWIEYFTGILVGSCANPLLLFSRDLVKFPSCLSFFSFLFFSTSCLSWWACFFSRCQFWWTKQGLLVSSRMISGCSLHPLWGWGYSWVGNSNPGQTRKQCPNWHPSKFINKNIYWKDGTQLI